MAVANDDFTETSDTALASHTPTGAGAGAGWTQTAGSMTVIASTDVVVDGNDGAGNRATMTTDLGDDEMDVQADFVSISAVAGDFVTVGFAARAPNGTTQGVIEAAFDFGAGANGQYFIGDGTLGDSLDEAWPGGTVTLKLEVRDGTARLLANDVEKVSITGSIAGAGNNFAGILLTNFDGNGTGKVSADNYLSSSFEAASPIASVAELDFTGQGDLSGVGALAGAAAIDFTPTATALASGLLAGAASIGFTPSASLTGTGALSGVALLEIRAEAERLPEDIGTLTGRGRLEAVSTLTFSATAEFVTTIEGLASIDLTAAASLSGFGALTAAAQLSMDAIATLSGGGSLAGNAALAFGPSGTVDGSGRLAGSASLQFTPAALIGSAGLLNAITVISLAGSATATGTGALAGAAALQFIGSAELSTDDQLAGVGSFAFSPVGALNAVGRIGGLGLFSFVPIGTLSGGDIDVTVRNTLQSLPVSLFNSEQTL
jgi:hypothetical protein